MRTKPPPSGAGGLRLEGRTDESQENEMCNQCPTVTESGICTHKDYDRICGCVECLYCQIVMIRCRAHEKGDDKHKHPVF
jgi:hypothetical protein